MGKRSPLNVIFLTIFIDLLGFGIIIPLASPIADTYIPEGGLVYFGHAFGRQALFALLMSAYSILQMIFSPVWGRISDRVGRRPILLLSLFGSTASYGIFAFSRSYETLLLARIVAGICGANITTAQAYIADVTTPAERTGGMRRIGAAFGMGFAFGPVLAVLALWIGHHLTPGSTTQLWPGLFAMAICGINFLWAVVGLPESLKPGVEHEALEHGHLKSLLRMFGYLGHPIIGPLIGIFFFATFAFSNMEVAFGLFMKNTKGLEVNIEHIPWAFVYIGLLLAFMHGYVNKIMLKRFTEPRLVVFGTVSQCLALALLPIYPSVTWIMLVLVLLCFGQGIMVPCLSAIVSRTASQSRQGEVMGVTQAVSSLARIAGPIFAAVMWAVGDKRTPGGGLRFPFWGGAVLMLIAVGLSLMAASQVKAAPEAESESGA